MGIDIEYRIWDIDMVTHTGHPGYRYGIWDIDMGDDSIDSVVLDIDMGYLVTLHRPTTSTRNICWHVSRLRHLRAGAAGMERDPSVEVLSHGIRGVSRIKARLRCRC